LVDGSWGSRREGIENDDPEKAIVNLEFLQILVKLMSVELLL
jgi:hypothetical protein